jgi:chromosomal replication initiator protein
MIVLEGKRVVSRPPLLTRELDAHVKKAIRGSRRLRNAIWKLQGYKPQPVAPKRPEVCPTCSGPIAPRRLVADIQRTVGAYYGFHANHLISSDRRRQLTLARQVAMYLATELTNHSIAEIGRRFKRDHTTVLHAIKAVGARAEINPELAFDVALLRERLTA